MGQEITYEYERQLAYFYHDIDRRGICVDEAKLDALRNTVRTEIISKCKYISGLWGCHVFVGAASDDGSQGSVNINSTKGERALLKKLKELGYTLPKIRTKNKDKEVEFKESAGDLVLQKVFAENPFKKHLSNGEYGDPAIKTIMEIRELKTLQDRYINAKLQKRTNGSFYLSTYNVAGTTSGRRSSRKTPFGYGGNGQNFPSHTSTSSSYRDCLIPRRGNIFFSVDQISAEDWPVSALSENYSALADLQSGADRHRKLACDLFNLLWDHYDDKTWKDSIERYLGKKTRHAGNYGMQGRKFSDVLAQEGKCFPVEITNLFLNKFHETNPQIKEVFHNYVKNELYNSRVLRTPLGRERQFFGLRPGSDNYDILNEAYSYIPQSTVGDNTGLAITSLFRTGHSNWIVQEGHDSIIQDLPDRDKELLETFKATCKAFDRVIRFYNGIEIQIPIEGQVGYSFDKMVKIKDFSEDGLLETVRMLRKTRQEQEVQLVANAATN